MPGCALSRIKLSELILTPVFLPTITDNLQYFLPVRSSGQNFQIENSALLLAACLIYVCSVHFFLKIPSTVTRTEYEKMNMMQLLALRKLHAKGRWANEKLEK